MVRYANKVFISLIGTKLSETAKAVKFSILKISGEPVDLPPEHKTQWFPLSQIQKMTTDPSSTGNDSIFASEWICREKGLLQAAATSRPAKIDEHGFDARDDLGDLNTEDDEDRWNILF